MWLLCDNKREYTSYTWHQCHFCCGKVSVSDSSASSRWSLEAILRGENSGMKKSSSSSELPSEFSQSLSSNCSATSLGVLLRDLSKVTTLRLPFLCPIITNNDILEGLVCEILCSILARMTGQLYLQDFISCK